MRTPLMLERLKLECPMGTKIIVEYADRIETTTVGANDLNDEFFDF